MNLLRFACPALLFLALGCSPTARQFGAGGAGGETASSSEASGAGGAGGVGSSSQSSASTSDAASSSASASSGGPAMAVVDQYNGVASGGIVCGGKQIITQTFTVGIGGQLAGIEVGAGLLNAPASSHMSMRLLDPVTLKQLGSPVVIPAAKFPPGYGTAPDKKVLGSGYFNFTASGIKVSVGQKLMFELTSPDQLVGLCSGGLCSGQPKSCMTNADCSGPPDLGLSDTNTNPYPGGAESVNGKPQDAFDLAFKTLVIP